MRRKDLEITDRPQIDAILERALVCRLGLSSGAQPYVVPLAFGYDKKALYFHGALVGRKMEIIRENPRVCFEVDIDHEVVRREGSCNWSIRYRSVIGFGMASIVEEVGAKGAALDVIMRHYGGQGYSYDERMLAATAVIRVDIESIHGKTRYGGKDRPDGKEAQDGMQEG